MCTQTLRFLKLAKIFRVLRAVTIMRRLEDELNLIGCRTPSNLIVRHQHLVWTSRSIGYAATSQTPKPAPSLSLSLTLAPAFCTWFRLCARPRDPPASHPLQSNPLLAKEPTPPTHGPPDDTRAGVAL